MTSAIATVARAAGRVSPRRFAGARAGSASVEFALILPVLLGLWAGATEYSHAVDNSRKLGQLARTVSDLTSIGDPAHTSTAMAQSVIDDIVAASTSVLRPFSSSTVKIVISAVTPSTLSLNARPYVCSSVANTNGTARSTGVAADLAVPPGFGTPGLRYVVTEVSMVYKPMIGSTLVKIFTWERSTITLTAAFPWPTRGGAPQNSTYTEVIMPGGVACPVNT